jgi:hypothetical protein
MCRLWLGKITKLGPTGGALLLTLCVAHSPPLLEGTCARARSSCVHMKLCNLDYE